MRRPPGGEISDTAEAAADLTPRRAPKPFVFVLMPFDPGFDDIYELGIKPACTASGAYCERVDEQIFDGTILDRIYNQIAKADLLVSDMSGRNPNVFYETGFAHALGKRVILLTQRAEDIPFDLQHFPHIVYEARIGDLKAALERRVSYFVEHPESVQPPSIHRLRIYADGDPIEESRSLLIRGGRIDELTWGFTIGFDLHNTSSTTLDGDEIQLALIVPRVFANSPSHPCALLPLDECVLNLGSIGRLLPDSWVPIRVRVRVSKTAFRAASMAPIPARLRVLTEVESQEYHFSISLSESSES